VAAGDVTKKSGFSHPNGRDRVALMYVEGTEGGSDFHSLVWERRRGDAWERRQSISRDDFMWRHPYRRWISELHFFDPESACAIIQVGEIPTSSGSGTVQYSWRRWNLLNNAEVELIRVCESPFEPYGKSED
jgi:hypothetical protein